MNACPRPLDPIDIEALASEEEPVLSADARLHASSCASCGQAVGVARRLAALLGTGLEGAPQPDLADRILRLRPFSRAERLRLTLWSGPLLLSLAVTGTGLLLVAGPGLGLREQAGLVGASASAAAGMVRALGRWAADLAFTVAPAFDALSDALRSEPPIGWASLLLLLPAGFGLRRVLARSPRR